MHADTALLRTQKNNSMTDWLPHCRGEGFCVFNDIAIAATVAIKDYNIQRILTLDLDVHQGNGTAKIFEQDPRVTTFDMHGDKNYPWKTRQKNTYDVALPDGTTDEQYLALLESWMPRLLNKHQPQLLFYQAGVDALAGDSFGRLALSRAGLNQRNNLVRLRMADGRAVLAVHLQHGTPCL